MSTPKGELVTSIISISLLIFFSQAYAGEDVLSTDISQYYKLRANKTVLDRFQPLKNAKEFLKILANRKVVDIDLNAKYIYLYGVGIQKDTLKLNGEITNNGFYKSHTIGGKLSLESYQCEYGICKYYHERGVALFIGYEGGILVSSDGFSEMEMYLSLTEAVKPFAESASDENSFSDLDEAIDGIKKLEETKEKPSTVVDKEQFD